MDDFEKHIVDNRAVFNEHTLDKGKMWGRISAELEQSGPEHVPFWKTSWMRIAATVIILIGIASIATLTVFDRTNSGEGSQLSQELNEIDMHYTGLVADQIRLVQNHPKLSETDKKEFLSFIEELDEEYLFLKSEMEKNLDNEKVLEAIVQNYKKRIELIERLLQQINDAKHSTDDYFTL